MKISGSSPLARGLPPNMYNNPTEFRIIPARAGFTSPCRSTGNDRRDHPRSRGVYLSMYGFIIDAEGSSPLARGLPAPRDRSWPWRRIIPARAGFTRPSCSIFHAPRDHPRSRGVYGWEGEGYYGRGGSSPLARGLRKCPRQRCGRKRIIPARAGFTGPQCARTSQPTDHPRSRGVYLQ